MITSSLLGLLLFLDLDFDRQGTGTQSAELLNRRLLQLRAHSRPTIRAKVTFGVNESKAVIFDI